MASGLKFICGKYQTGGKKYQTKCTSSGVTSFPVFMSKTLWSTASRLTTESGSAVTVTSRSAWGSDMLVDISRLTCESQHVSNGQVDKRLGHKDIRETEEKSRLKVRVKVSVGSDIFI